MNQWQLFSRLTQRIHRIQLNNLLFILKPWRKSRPLWSIPTGWWWHQKAEHPI